MIRNIIFKFLRLFGFKPSIVYNYNKYRKDLREWINQGGVITEKYPIKDESMINEIKDSVTGNESVFLRGFGTFKPKKRAEKTGRNIKKNTAIIINFMEDAPQ